MSVARPLFAAEPAKSVSAPAALLQRKCNCGTHTPAGATCRTCAGKASGLQRHLAIGRSDDPLEHEADRTADDVLAQRPASSVSVAPARIQRLATQPGGEAAAAPESVHQSFVGSGAPLETGLRRDMEARFGQDFAGVRVHTDAAAAHAAQEVGAKAFTFANRIAFGAGHFSPQGSEGRHLLAHELAHVVQQRGNDTRTVRLAKLSQYKTKDPKHDPAKLTDAEVEATDEFKTLMNPKLVWQWSDKVTRDEALLCCRLMIRQLREGGTITWETDARVFMNVSRKQLGATKKAESGVGNLEWVPFNSSQARVDPSKLQSDFARWLLSGDAEPDATNGKVNCWEMVMFSAFKGGFTTKARIKGIYDEGVKQLKAGTRSFMGETIEAELRRGAEQTFTPGLADSPEPLPGDIIIFSTAANHAAVSLGTKDGAGRHKIVSHWPPPDGSSRSKLTTIEVLLADPQMKAGTVIKFWSPKW